MLKSAAAAMLKFSPCVFAGSPEVSALIVISEPPSAVFAAALIPKVTVTGLALVGLAVVGVKLQFTPVGNPEQERATSPENAPCAEINSDTGGLALPGTTLTDAGDGAPSVKSTM